MGIDVPYLSKSEIVADGKVTVIINRYYPRPDCDDGPPQLTIHVRRNYESIHVFEVTADEIQVINQEERNESDQ